MNEQPDAPQDTPKNTTTHLAALPRVGRRVAKRAIGVGGIILLAGISGYVGAMLRQSDGVSTTTLSGQRQIVTSQGQLINKIAKDVGPSVVSIDVTTQAATSSFFFGSQSGSQQAAGTGVVISKNGVIMTNRHVVPAGTTKVSVTLSDGTTYDDVKVLGRTNSGDSLDVAFLKIMDLKGRALTPASIGNSSASRIGDQVVAIGNALGEFQNTVTSGIISGFGRQVQAGSSGGYGSSDVEALGNLIQTDTAINEGNSGGPLVNLNGQVIGINTAVASGAENIGFAIPINDLKGLIRQVLETGSFARPYLGIRYAMLTPVIAKEYGLDSTSGAYVIPSGLSGEDPIAIGSPADEANLESGDIIKSINGTALTSKVSLTTALNKYQPGDKVRLSILRDGKKIVVSVVLGKSPTE